MNPEKEEKLVEKYPKIFKDVHDRKGPRESLMCFGMECGDGWYEVLDELCSDISKVTDTVRATQVKEKYGRLEFYYRGEAGEAGNMTGKEWRMVSWLVDRANVKSVYTCEECGEPGYLRCSGHWFYTACDECSDRNEEVNKEAEYSEVTHRPADKEFVLNLLDYAEDFETITPVLAESIVETYGDLEDRRGEAKTRLIKTIEKICKVLNKPIDTVLSKIQSKCSNLKFWGVDTIRSNDKTTWQSFWGKVGSFVSKVRFSWNPLYKRFGCKFRDGVKVYRKTDRAEDPDEPGLGEIVKVEYCCSRKLFGFEC